MKNQVLVVALLIAFILPNEWVNITSSVEKSPEISVEEFDGNNTTKFRMKSAKNNKYLHHEGTPNRRGQPIEKQSSEKDIHTLFGFNRSATGNDFKGDEFKSED